MKWTIFLSLILWVSCNLSEDKNTTTDVDTLDISPDTSVIEEDINLYPPSEPHSNNRFKDVTVERIAEDSFLVKGQAQIFEANLSWVVEDGHMELKNGFETTDAGAPEWGNFEFVIQAEKVREHSTLMLILFESSAKDGSRQSELPIVLY